VAQALTTTHDDMTCKPVDVVRRCHLDHSCAKRSFACKIVPQCACCCPATRRRTLPPPRTLPLLLSCIAACTQRAAAAAATRAQTTTLLCKILTKAYELLPQAHTAHALHEQRPPLGTSRGLGADACPDTWMEHDGSNPATAAATAPCLAHTPRLHAGADETRLLRLLVLAAAARAASPAAATRHVCDPPQPLSRTLLSTHTRASVYSQQHRCWLHSHLANCQQAGRPPL
jgi:hypothetical protein